MCVVVLVCACVCVNAYVSLLQAQTGKDNQQLQAGRQGGDEGGGGGGLVETECEK